jgi:hypothetical protein
LLSLENQFFKNIFAATLPLLGICLSKRPHHSPYPLAQQLGMLSYEAKI